MIRTGISIPSGSDQGDGSQDSGGDCDASNSEEGDDWDRAESVVGEFKALMHQSVVTQSESERDVSESEEDQFWNSHDPGYRALHGRRAENNLSSRR